MTRFALDASTTLAWFFEDERDARADVTLDLLDAGSAIVPPIWPAEVGNALLAGERRKRITSAEVARALALLRKLDIRVVGGGPLLDLEELVALAKAEKPAVHDASYLLLATREGVPLACLDRSLAPAAGRWGVRVL